MLMTLGCSDPYQSFGWSSHCLCHCNSWAATNSWDSFSRVQLTYPSTIKVIDGLICIKNSMNLLALFKVPGCLVFIHISEMIQVRISVDLISTVGHQVRGNLKHQKF